jgi:hypothetical protein
MENLSFIRQPFYAYIGRAENPSGFIFPLRINTEAGPMNIHRKRNQTQFRSKTSSSVNFVGKGARGHIA